MKKYKEPAVNVRFVHGQESKPEDAENQFAPENKLQNGQDSKSNFETDNADFLELVQRNETDLILVDRSDKSVQDKAKSDQNDKARIASVQENKFPEEKEAAFAQQNISEPGLEDKSEHVEKGKLGQNQDDNSGHIQVDNLIGNIEADNSGHIQDDKSDTIQEEEKIKQGGSNNPMQQILDEIIDKVKDISDAELKEVILFKMEAVKTMLIETSADPTPSAPPPPPPAPPPPAPRPTFQLKFIQRKNEGVELTVKKKSTKGQSADLVNELKNALKKRFRMSIKNSHTALGVTSSANF